MRPSVAFGYKLLTFVLICLIASCTAPRSVINSGKVTAPGRFKAGVNFGGNIATEPIGQLDDITRAAVDAIAKKDTVFYDDEVEAATRAMLAYALDPVGPTFDLYLRYGVVERVDIGYKYASGLHVFDAMFRFMGPTGTPASPGGDERWYGSIGLQYAGQSTDWMNKLFLSKLQPILQFTAKRRDVTVPLIFSKSFGVEEEHGSVAFGAVYNHTSIKYGFEPGRLYKKYSGKSLELDAFKNENSYSSYGLFVNVKVGYKGIYLLPALTMYYQNYGSYKLLDDKAYNFSGMTFIPSVGLQANFGKGRK